MFFDISVLFAYVRQITAAVIYDEKMKTGKRHSCPSKSIKRVGS